MYISISVALDWSSTEIGNWLWRKKWWEELFGDSGHNNVSVLMVIKAVIHESDVFCENCDNNTDQHCAFCGPQYKVLKIGNEIIHFASKNYVKKNQESIASKVMK